MIFAPLIPAAPPPTTRCSTGWESGLRRPTLDVLLTPARVHRVTIDALVGAPATGDPRVHPRPTVRHGTTWLALGQHPGGIQAHEEILPAGPGEPPEQRSHEGYEWLYVLEGRLRLLLGDHDMVLTVGEAAEVDTRTPPPSPTPARAPRRSCCSWDPRASAPTCAPDPPGPGQ